MRILAIVMATVLVCPAPAEQGQMDSDVTLFTVLAAINVAGYDAALDSASASPARAALRKDLAGFQGASLPLLRNFYQQHKLADPIQDVAQYVSFALQSSGPPEFKFRLPYGEISPDAQPLHGLARLLEDFYREAEIPTLFARYQAAHEQEIARYHEPVTKAVLESNGYLRMPTSGYLGRRFQVYFDLLSAPNRPTVRGYGADVFVVVHPSRELFTQEIRHAYLHYLLDPFSSKYASAVEAKKGLGGLAMFAPALDESYKTDFALLLTECLIKAVEARMKYGAEKQKLALVDQALTEGFILTPHFYEQLVRFESSQEGIRFFYPEMVKAIDEKRENQRLRAVSFAERPPDRKLAAEPARAALSGPARTLQEAEDSFRRNQLELAKKLFLQAQQETDSKDARPLYGLARIAALEKDPERAKELFHQALSRSPNPHVQAMSHLYLGRIEDLFGSREQAILHYKESLAAGDTTPGAREAAEKGLKESFAAPKK